MSATVKLAKSTLFEKFGGLKTVRFEKLYRFSKVVQVHRLTHYQLQMFSTEALNDMSKEELIAKTKQLQTHVNQLKNVIAKKGTAGKGKYIARNQLRLNVAGMW